MKALKKLGTVLGIVAVGAGIAAAIGIYVDKKSEKELDDEFSDDLCDDSLDFEDEDGCTETNDVSEMEKVDDSKLMEDKE